MILSGNNIEKLNDIGIPGSIANRFSELLSEVCEFIMNEQYSQAHERLNTKTGLSDAEILDIRRLLTDHFLLARQKAWSGHGIWRSFRFWSRQEKVNYLNRANNIITLLEAVIPNVVFGFGSVLGFIRDNDFIPHDDDMDLLVAFPVGNINSYSVAKAMLMAALADKDIKVYNENRTHFTVNGVDIFIGFCELDNAIAWFPSRRKSGLVMDDVFPVKIIKVLGVDVKIPKNSDKYLEVTYGSKWRMPDSNWHHPWSIDEYLDYCDDSLCIGKKTMIPKNITQIFIPPIMGAQLLPEVRYQCAFWKSKHAEYDYNLINLDSIKSMVGSRTNWLDALYSLRFPAMQCDLARLIYLYLYGGFYADLKVFPLESMLDSLVSFDLVLIEHWPTENCPDTTGLFINNFIGCTPGNPIIKQVIDQIIYNVSNRLQDSVFRTTGPTVLSDIANTHDPYNNPNIQVLSFSTWNSLLKVGSGKYNEILGHWTERTADESIYID